MDGSHERTDDDTNEAHDGTDPSNSSDSSSTFPPDTTESGLPRTVLVAGAIAAIGIVMTGVVVNLLNRVGPAGSADVMWVLGYGITIFVLWYLLVRPIDFSQRY